MDGLTMRSIKKSKDTLEQMKIGTQQSKTYEDTAKAVLRWKFRALHAYLKKQEKSQINNLTLLVKEFEK